VNSEPDLVMLVVCLAGLHSSGKSVFSDVAHNLGFIVVRMGDVVREEMRKEGKDITPQSIQEFSIECRRRRGNTVFARLTADKVSRDAKLVLIDGLRSLDEYDFFKKEFRKCVLVAVHASPGTRFSRRSIRARPDDPNDYQGFLKSDLLDLNLGVGYLLALADHHLINEDMSIDSFREQSERLLQRLAKTACDVQEVPPS